MDDVADREFVKQHEALVRKLAGRVRAQLDLSVDLDDLIAYGFRGLVEARDRFDPSRGVLFTTFAHYRIRGAILDGVRQMAYLPRKAHEQRRAAEALDRMAEAVALDRGANPDERAELAGALDAIDEILTKTSAAFVIAALGQSPDDAPPGAEEELSVAQTRARVRAALEHLPARERALIEGHYFEDRTLEEIGESMGISKSWASRLHSRALGILAAALEGQLP
jgi:RNA polymerase sigma factor for flagellar operon FliA